MPAVPQFAQSTCFATGRQEGHHTPTIVYIRTGKREHGSFDEYKAQHLSPLDIGRPMRNQSLAVRVKKERGHDVVSCRLITVSHPPLLDISRPMRNQSLAVRVKEAGRIWGPTPIPARCWLSDAKSVISRKSQRGKVHQHQLDISILPT